MSENKIDILYLCDAEHNDDCLGKLSCHLNGGPCRLTKDEAHSAGRAGFIALYELDAKLPAMMEDYYQKWAYLTPEAVMKMIHGEEV